MSKGREIDDTSRLAMRQQREQEVGQKEVAKVISAHLHLETILSLHKGTHHHTWPM